MARPKKNDSEKVEVKNKNGRPTLYKEEYNEQVYKLCLLGADDVRIADFFNVSVATISNWKNEHEKFLASIKNGKEVADLRVADSLYNRATGYTSRTRSENVTEEVIAPVSTDEKGKHKTKLDQAQQDFEKFKSVEDAKTVKYKSTVNIQEQHFPPDVTAQIFWLKNRQPKLWRDKQEISADVNSNVTINVTVEEENEG